MAKRNWWRRSLNRHFRLLEKRSRALEQKRRIEKKSVQTQKKLTLDQQEKALERIPGARKRGKATSRMDTMERRHIAKELMWRGKWTARTAKWEKIRHKFNALARKMQPTTARIKAGNSG